MKQAEFIEKCSEFSDKIAALFPDGLETRIALAVLGTMIVDIIRQQGEHADKCFEETIDAMKRCLLVGKKMDSQPEDPALSA